ncbi:MAG: FAD/NAD(P)-binding oxidoreductase [Nitrosospira sp.]
MSDVIPKNAQWIQAAATGFDPASNLVKLTDGRSIGYKQLIVCPGLRLAWEKIEGLEETLGKNGITSNYRFDLAPYTWSLVHNLKGGKALLPNLPCRSNVRARHKKRCTFHAIIGCGMEH